MKNQEFLSLSEVSSFMRNMGALNNDGSLETEAAMEECKSAVKKLYSFAGKQIDSGTVWNWGLDNEEIDARIRQVLPGYDAVGTDGFSEQLYCFALHATGIQDFSGKKLLDVGCGFGEGANFLSRIFQPGEIVGVDLCREAIDHANARLARRRLTFVCGDAENLPFEDGEVDIVINVESSHTYPNLGRFLVEVERVLKPGGCFSHVDVFTEQRYTKLDELKARSSLKWTQETDVTEQVKRAIQKRLAPGSFLRQTLSKNKLKQVAFSSLLEPIVLVNYGADFVGHKFNFMQRASKQAFWWMASRSGPLRDVQFNRYMHNLAWKE